jgi:hypothetical protein
MGKRLQTVLREAAKRIDFESPSLSFRRIREAANRLADLHEANSESTFAWLLRSAVQEFSNRVYTDMPVIYPNFVTEVTSRRRSEVYGGLYRPNLPNQVDAGEKFRDTSFKGFERELVNYKEIFVISRLFGLERTEEGVDVPASTYNGGTVFSTTIGNRPTSFARLSDTTLEAAHVAARSITDPLGRKFLHTPKVLIVSPIDEFAAFRLINSPAMPTTSAGTFSAMVNPLQGRYTVFSSPFVPSKAWLVGDPKRGFVFQRRDPLEIIQENPASGQSFIQEVYAFRGRERFNADWIEPRFAYLGNDGSV